MSSATDDFIPTLSGIPADLADTDKDPAKAITFAVKQQRNLLTQIVGERGYTFATVKKAHREFLNWLRHRPEDGSGPLGFDLFLERAGWAVKAIDEAEFHVRNGHWWRAIEMLRRSVSPLALASGVEHGVRAQERKHALARKRAIEANRKNASKPRKKNRVTGFMNPTRADLEAFRIAFAKTRSDNDYGWISAAHRRYQISRETVRKICGIDA